MADSERILVAANTAIFEKDGRYLSDVETVIILGAIAGKTYDRTAEDSGYSIDYLKHDVGPKLWRSLSSALDEKVGKANFKQALDRYLASQQSSQFNQHQIDWGEAPDVSFFLGRSIELHTLRQWILGDACRLTALLGIGGIGKTALGVKLARELQSHFDFVICRSLRNAPLREQLIRDLILFISQQQEREFTLLRLIYWLKSSRCLLILDNWETLLQPGQAGGHYLPGYENYGELLRILGESAHQSCILLTSREKPAELAMLEGPAFSVRSLKLHGSLEAALGIINVMNLKGTEQQKHILSQHYGCNPLALKIVTTSIQDLFDGDIGVFLTQNITAFNSIHRLLDQQFCRLSSLEHNVMYWLAINRGWTSLSELESDIVPSISRAKVLEAIESLNWRSLIEISSIKNNYLMQPTTVAYPSVCYTQQPVVMEFVTDRLVQWILAEIIGNFGNVNLKVVLISNAHESEQSTPLHNWRNKKPISPESEQFILPLFCTHALIKTTVKDYVRESQIRMILNPITRNLQSVYTTHNALKQKLKNILSLLREESISLFGYAAGNLLNICLYLHIDLSGCDFSNLRIWHACLESGDLRKVNFKAANFDKSSFTQAFSQILSVTYAPKGCCATSPNQQVLAIGDSNGEIRLWQVPDGELLLTLQGHTQWIWSLAWSPDGLTLASGSTDQTVRLWNPLTGQCTRVLKGHRHWVWSVSWHPNSKILASSSGDHTLKLWNSEDGQCINTLHGHNQWVSFVAWHPDGQTLASASGDHSIKIWNFESGQCLKTLRGHSDWVGSVAWSPNGQTLASGSADLTVKLWNPYEDQCLNTLKGHTLWVWSIAWSPDGQIIASSSGDHTVRLWNPSNGQCQQILEGHQNWVWSVAWSPDGQTLATGSTDQTTRLWSLGNGLCLKTFHGHSNWVRSVAWSPDGQILASGSEDHHVRLWNPNNGECLQTLKGHDNWVWSVTWSPDGQTIASGSGDNQIKLWNPKNGQCLQTLSGHNNWIWSVTWSPDGTTLASGSEDQTVRLWNSLNGQCLQTLQGFQDWILSVTWSPDGQTIATGSEDQTVKLWNPLNGQCLNTLKGHSHQVWSVAWSPDGKTLASGSEDQTVKLWNPLNGQCLNTLKGHSHQVWSVAWSPDGQTLASSSSDNTIRVWNVLKGECCKVLEGHDHWVWSVAWSPDGQTLASGGADETIRLWDIPSGKCLKTFSAGRPYQGMNISEVTGLTTAQRATLEVLGAIKI